jgi:hypothetical protein
MNRPARRTAFVLYCTLAAASAAHAADVGRIKVSSGPVHIERDGQRLPGAVDTPVQASDTIVTGPNASAGLTFVDNTRIAVGSNSVFSINRYSFNSVSHSGRFDATIRQGTLGVVTGGIPRSSPGAMIVRTPTSVMGVRGTEFVVRVGE